MHWKTVIIENGKKQFLANKYIITVEHPLYLASHDFFLVKRNLWLKERYDQLKTRVQHCVNTNWNYIEGNKHQNCDTYKER